MTTTRRITTAIATGAVLLNALVPSAFAATSLTISGNGSGSVSDVKVESENKVEVKQNNDANINNNVDVKGNTGGNEASGNVGGKVEIETGNATANVSVNNATNTNTASVQNCCGEATTVNITGNGSGSDNEVRLNQDNKVELDQDNDADIDNNVDVDAETGYNDANDNVGGAVKVTTGDTDSTVKVHTAANANSAMIGGGSEEGGVSAWISGNGSDSDNEIDLDLENNVDLDQDNDADVDNDVDVDAETGYNDANDNVGGDVEIVTGDADATVEVDTLVNFNGADVDSCGCTGDLVAKIAGNGSDSDNEIAFEAENETEADQDNEADVDNDVDVDGETGDNEADDNVGYDGSDPRVTTGDADATVDAHTASNANFFGETFDFEWDWNELLGWLGL